MPFEKEAFFFTMLIIAGNAAILVVINTPGFEVTMPQTEASSTQYFSPIVPSGLQFWNDANKEIDNSNLQSSGLADSSGSFASTNPDIASIFITAIMNLPALLISAFQILVFLIIGYILLMQIALAPSWLIFLVAAIVTMMQVWGLLYVASYVLNAFRGRL